MARGRAAGRGRGRGKGRGEPAAEFVAIEDLSPADDREAPEADDEGDAFEDSDSKDTHDEAIASPSDSEESNADDDDMLMRFVVAGGEVNGGEEHAQQDEVIEGGDGEDFVEVHADMLSDGLEELDDPGPSTAEVAAPVVAPLIDGDPAHEPIIHDPSASSSSGDPAPPPRDVPDPYDLLPRKPEGDVMHVLPNGCRIVYYAKTKKFEADCCNLQKHGRCRKTMSALGPTGRYLFSNPGQGRPLAFLMLWCRGHSLDTQREHLYVQPTFEIRRAARERIYASKYHTLRQLAACERRPFPTEGWEPEILEG